MILRSRWQSEDTNGSGLRSQGRATANPCGNGSFSYTSSAAPAIHFSRSAFARAASSTTGPREVFTRNAVGFIRRSVCSLNR